MHADQLDKALSRTEGCPMVRTSWLNTGDQEWHRAPIQLHSLHDTQKGDLCDLLPNGFAVAIIEAEATKISSCPTCRRHFTNKLVMPRLWWTGYCKNSNGYLGFEETRDENGSIASLNSWTLLQTKHLVENGRNVPDYEWYRLNLFVRWVAASKQTVLIAFDTPPGVVDSLRRLLIEDLSILLPSDPLWIYAAVVEEVISLQDDAVWTIRHKIRAVEKNRAPVDNPQPDFEHFHEIFRHAIHVSETLDLGIKMIRKLITRHEKYLSDKDDHVHLNNIHDRLLFLEHMLNSLRLRSASNKERLTSEIQLAFNTVAQYDSTLALQIGQAAQHDSAAMKTIAVVTLTFLPATFISAVFSMSFFNYDPDAERWAISGMFWLYWVVAIPVTALTFLVWNLWWRIFPPTYIGPVKKNKEVGHDVKNTPAYINLQRVVKINSQV